MAFSIDGLSGLLLGVLGLCGLVTPIAWRRWVVVAPLMLCCGAADGVVFLVGLGGALVAGSLVGGAPRRLASVAAVVGLAVAMVALGGLDPRFAAMRGGVEGVRGAVVLAGVVAGVAALPWALPGLGGVVAVYAAARMLLDLAGTATPGWWGVPVLALGAGGAVWAARRMAAAGELGEAVEQAGVAALSVAAMGVGAALLARGADMLPLAGVAVAGALLQVLAWSVWGGLLQVCLGVVGGSGLDRCGGLLRRAPATGLAMLVGLAGVAAVPVGAGFAGVWMVLQAVFGAGRAGGIAVLLLVAGAVAAWGLAWSLLAAGAVRLGGVVLLGQPRSGRAAGMVEARLGVRLAMAGWAAGALVLGVYPAAGLWLVGPAVRVVAVDGPEWVGYPGPLVAGLLVAGAALVGWIAVGPVTRTRVWEGGLTEAAAAPIWPIVLPVPSVRRVDVGRAVLIALGLALAVSIGWVAR